MFEYFLEKFKDKTNDELLNILNNKIEYRHEAVDAAIKIYNERNNTSIPFYKRDEEIKQIQPLNRKPFSFIISLNASDFYTLITTAMCLLAIFSLISLYEDEFFLKGNSGWIENVIFLLSFFVIHIFYKIDNRISNTYLKRIQFDLLYLLVFLVLKHFVTFIFDGFNFNSLNISFQTIGSLLGTFIFIFLLELIFEMIKRVLKVLRTEII